MHGARGSERERQCNANVTVLKSNAAINVNRENTRVHSGTHTHAINTLDMAVHTFVYMCIITASIRYELRACVAFKQKHLHDFILVLFHFVFTEYDRVKSVNIKY